MDSLPQSELDQQKAHIGDNRSTTVIAISSLFTAVAVLSLIARLAARRLARVSIGWDDYLATLTTVDPYSSSSFCCCG